MRNLYINNNLFTEKFLQDDLKTIHNFNEDISEKFEKLKSIFDIEKFKKLNEAQLEKEFIKIVLEDILNYSVIPQITKKIQGKNDKPDFGLFANRELKEKHLKIDDKSSNEDILLFCEAKAYDVKLDSGKIDFKLNPHFQLMHYLTYLRVDYGFLTNGKFWRFYDVKDNRANKVFFEINLEEIILNDDLEAFKYFYNLFKKDNFAEAKIEEIINSNENTKFEIEEDLKSVIYGKNSILELVAKEIYKNSGSKDLKLIFNDSLYFTFRLLFISYFESKFEQVIKNHKYYSEYSLDSIYDYLESLKEARLKDFVGFRKLKELFNILNSGDDELEIPLFNGGLFDESKTKLLTKSRLLDNSVLKEVLYKLLNFKNGTFRRDFKALSVIHIGNIYEGLLEFELRVAKERLYYVEVDKSEHYYDIYDFNSMKDKKFRLIDEVERGKLYLVNRSNSRKTTASYYTPKELSEFMVKSAIDLELSKNRDILNLKVLDNACGSGHFLVEALNYITQKAYENIDNTPKVSELISEEEIKIRENLSGFETDTELDELSILKRMLLKRVIYGVDLNPFAIELTRLSLWIDTFIFGTPLSFIEHHIKVGNSLIGSSIDEFKSRFSGEKNRSLLNINFDEAFNELSIVFNKLDNLRDTTAKEIQESKTVYRDEIEPILIKLNSFLHTLTLEKMGLIEIENIDSKIDTESFEIIDRELKETIEKSLKLYRFFNYNIEFPEAIDGFDIVIGNPPWDKTKFDDKDFFSQFRSNYRTMKNSEKVEVQETLFSENEVEEKYKSEKEYVKITNEYYKKYYPLNAGSGDGNLFRFFIEKNLSLLAKDANLTYLFPATFISEDGSTNLRKYILDNLKMNLFYGFENRKKIFKDVDARFKFAIIQLENQKVDNQVIKTRFMQRDAEILNSSDSILEYDLETIKALSPNHYALLELQNSKDLEIIKKAYLKFRQIDNSYIDFRNELHMTADKDLFKEEAQKNLIPLYEGKMIWQFDSKFEKPNYLLNIDEFDKRLESKEISRMVKDIGHSKKELQDRIHLKSEKELNKFIKFDREFFKLGFRAIASNTNERTLIFSILFKNCGYGHSMMANIPKQYILIDNKIEIEKVSNLKLLFLNSIFNSLILDYLTSVSLKEQESVFEHKRS